VITWDLLDTDTAFVLPCCTQDISLEAAVMWLKQSEAKGCPCCRDASKARLSLVSMGYDLTPVPVAGDVLDIDQASVQIFEGVMAGISASRNLEDRCRKYADFGVGLLNQGHYRLANILIGRLGDQLMAADPLEKPKIGKVFLRLLRQYNGEPMIVSIPIRRKGLLERIQQKFHTWRIAASWRFRSLFQ